jgi:HK97 family phage portal protein
MIARNENRILWLPNEERMWDEDAGSRSSAGVRISPDNALMVSTVFACIRVLAEAVATPALHVLERMRDGGKRRASELPLYRRLNLQPNGWQTSFEWRCQLMLHAGLYNVAYCEIVPGQSGSVEQLIPLHPSRMKVERLENGKLRYKYREEKGQETVYNQEQILAIRGLTEDGINGLSPVETCKDAIALARAYELHGARYFAAGARPGFVLSTEGQLNAEARETLASQWDRKHAGVGNSHRTAVLTGGLKPFGLPQNTNTDSQWLEGRRFQIEEICRLWRVPAWKIQAAGAMPPGSLESSSQEFLTDTIMPWLRRFESAFTRDLIVEDDRFEVSFDTRFMLRADSTSRSGLYRQLWDLGVYSTNDIRAEEGLNPVEGGDTRYRPLNMGTLGEMPTEGDVLAQQQPGSGIDGQAVEGGLDAAAGEPVVPATPGEPAETSLSTAEVSSLLTVVKQITDGMLTVDAARAIIAAAFPVLSAARVETILQGVAVKQEEPAAPAPVPQTPAVGRSLEERAKPGSVSEGDFVSWNSSGGRARGRVDHVMDYGTLDVPGTDFKLDASEKDPAALITVYEQVAGGWRKTDTKVGHKVQTLTKIDPLASPPADSEGRSLPEFRALTISMDFDRTFAADPTLWGEFARKAVADGNTVVMISRRPEEDRQTVAETLGDYADAFSQVLLVGGDTMKGDAAQAAGIDVDVWVDDSPQTITPAKPCDECEDKPKTRSRKK